MNVSDEKGSIPSYPPESPGDQSSSSQPAQKKWYSRVVNLFSSKSKESSLKLDSSVVEIPKREGKKHEFRAESRLKEENEVDEALKPVAASHFNFPQNRAENSIPHIVREIPPKEIQHDGQNFKTLNLDGIDEECWEHIRREIQEHPKENEVILQRNQTILSVPTIILKTLLKSKPNVDKLFKCDYKIILAKDESINLDGFTRAFLMVHSPIFKAMWAGQFQEAINPAVTKLHHVTANDFHKLIEDLHYKPSGLPENILDLINLANEFGISLLEKKYQNDLNNFIKGLPINAESLEQAISIFQFARDRNLQDTLESVQSFFDSYTYQLREPTELVKFLKELSESKIITDVTLSMPARADITWLDIISSFPIRKLNLSHRRDVTTDWIKHLPAELQTLDVSHCVHLTDESFQVLPRSLLRLNMAYCGNITIEGIKFLPPHLQDLNVSNCQQMTDDWMKQLYISFPNLQSLNVSNCKALTDSMGQYLSRSLRVLNLAHCNLTDRVLVDLPDPLQSLNISNCTKIKGTTFQHLPQGLQSLNASWCQLENDGLRYLRQGLKSLILAGCQEITTKGFQYLPSSLEHLDISHCDQLTDEDLQYVSSCLSLRDLNLSNCLFTENGLRDLPSSLLKLNLSYCTNLNINTLSYIPPSVRSLNFANCDNLTDEWLIRLTDFLVLEELILSNCKNVTSKGLQYLPRSLLKLDLNGFANLSVECFKTLPPLLQILIVANCKGITPECLSQLPVPLLTLDLSSNHNLKDNWLQNLPSLQELSLTQCPQLTHQGITLLPRSLRILNLSKCLITDEALNDLPTLLIILVIFNCPNLTKKAVDKLSESLRITSNLK